MVRKITEKGKARQLDEIWKRNVYTRDENKCQVCGTEVSGHNKQAHHIIPKGIKGMRWDLNNGITLCYRHHKIGRFSAHLNAVWFTYWLKTQKLEQHNYIVEKLKGMDRR